VSNEKELRRREDESRRRRVVKFVMQGLKYMMGYLPDCPFDVQLSSKTNPLIFLIKVHWGTEDFDAEKMPTILKKELEKIEQEASKSNESMRQSKIP